MTTCRQTGCTHLHNGQHQLAERDHKQGLCCRMHGVCEYLEPFNLPILQWVLASDACVPAKGLVIPEPTLGW